MKRSSGTASNLYRSIHQKLKMLALAAVVAVVSLLALAQRSEAKIVYTPTNVGIGKSYKLDLKNDGVTDFTIQNTFSWTDQCDHYASLSELPASGNAVVPYNDIDGSFAAALVKNAPIGSGQQFGGAETMAISYVRAPCLPGAEGPWVSVTQRYLGLRFQVKGRSHYGWARLNVQYHVSRDGFDYFIATLTGYAYETIAGRSIKAGQTKEAADELEEDDFGLKAEDAETLGGKPVVDFVLRDPNIPGSDAAETSSPGFCSPQNCVIKRCLVRNNKLFGGYCLEGARGGICHESYDPTHCPSGKVAKMSVQKQCGPSQFTVDNLRPCQ